MLDGFRFVTRPCGRQLRRPTARSTRFPFGNTPGRDWGEARLLCFGQRTRPLLRRRAGGGVAEMAALAHCEPIPDVLVPFEGDGHFVWIGHRGVYPIETTPDSFKASLERALHCEKTAHPSAADIEQPRNPLELRNDRTLRQIRGLDGSEFVYTDFKDSRKEAVAKAEARDQAILAVREQQKGRPLTIRESLEPPRRRKCRRASQTRTPESPHPAIQ